MMSGRKSQQQFLPNPFPVTALNEEAMWERTIDVLHDFHLTTARENRLARVVETEYFVGSGLLEPWHSDSVGFMNRLESTTQSIRRKVIISFVQMDAAGGFQVSVQAMKEREDLPGIAGNSPGAATFRESTPLNRELDAVVGQSAQSLWIPIGRDPALEQAILQRLQTAYFR